MKKILLIFLFVFMIVGISSCGDETSTDGKTKETYNIEGDPFRLSSIVDETDENGVASYAVYAPYTDSYTINCTKSSRIVVYNQNGIIKEGSSEVKVNLQKNQIYGVRVETNGEKLKFKLHSVADNHLVTLPYDVSKPVDTSSFSTTSNGTDPLKDATINYVKREGGKYIYSNNPEMFRDDAVGKAFIRNTDLTGDIFFTFEHANFSSTDVYLGYQLKNDGTDDAYVTVTNIGFQAGGTWFGQYAWYDYYNTSFQLPMEYLSNMGAYSKYDYAYQNYSPRIFNPTTYRIPAGEYIWVMGGTSEDSYLNISVDKSADKLLGVGKCANGNIKFNVSSGSVTGTFFAYNDISQVLTSQNQQGYRVGNYAAQYSGIADHAGVIDCDIAWCFDDSTKNGRLPVTYTNYYDDNVPAYTTPYAEYNNTAHTVTGATNWLTHLNPQNEHKAVGMDIVEFTWVDEFGDPVVIDNYHADGGGNPANTANWMIEYQENYTFVNQGDNTRNVTISYKDGGTLAVIVRNTLTGDVISTGYSMGQADLNYNFNFNVAAHNVVQITIQYVLVACSYGNVTHWVTLGN